jgi:hypothetical protein
MHVNPWSQMLPQDPQLKRSEPVSTQVPPQVLFPWIMQGSTVWACTTFTWQFPFTHCWEIPQVFPQDPQFFMSLLVLTQETAVPMQTVCPAGQVGSCTVIRETTGWTTRTGADFSW